MVGTFSKRLNCVKCLNCMYRYKYVLDLVNELRDADHEGLEVVLQGPGPDLDVARVPAELRHPPPLTAVCH